MWCGLAGGCWDCDRVDCQSGNGTSTIALVLVAGLEGCSSVVIEYGLAGDSLGRGRGLSS